jgi:hypothetical protein
MNDITQRVFPLRLASCQLTIYASYLRRLHHLLERLGRDCTLAVWQEVPQADDDALLRQVLGTGWQDVASGDQVNVEGSIAGLLAGSFPTAIGGVAGDEARRLVEELPPIRQIRQAFPSLNVWRETTAYEALHLRSHGLAMLAEALIRFHGKQGELIAYDMQREERIEAGGGKAGSVAEFIADFTSQPKEANLLTTGLETAIVHRSEREVVLHVRECAWAKYYRERHPAVGYLLACSTDEAAYRAFNPRLRMQRTGTLMEGAAGCDFRVYAADEMQA